MLIKLQGEANWRVPQVSAYQDEAAIQTLLAQSPDLLPGFQNRRLVVATEFPVESGYVDIVGISPDGDITLVECKLRANPEIRRHVIGQMMAYAAAAWEMSYEAFDAAFSVRAGSSLAHAVQAVAGEDWDEEAFRLSVVDNLRAGRFTLVIAVDQITSELRQIVRFLNTHTTGDLEVLALELGYVADSGVEILLPTTYGEQTKAPPLQTAKWSEERFFAAIGTIATPAEVAVMRGLYDFSIGRGAKVSWGVGPLASVTGRFLVSGKPLSLLSLYEWPKGQASVAVNFEYLVGNASWEQIAQLAADLRSIPGVAERLAGIEQADYRKRPTIPCALLVKQGSVETMIIAIDRFLASA